MPLIPPADGASKIPLISEGVHIGICYSLVDLGVQTFEYMGKAKSAHKVLITWEIPGEIIEVEDKETGETKQVPRAISKKYTFSLHEKANLRHDLVNWRGRSFTDDELLAFDLKNVLGKACQIQVVHETNNGKTYASPKALMALPKGTPVPPLQNKQIYFCIADLEAPNIPEEVPEWVQKMILASEDWNRLAARHGQSSDVSRPSTLTMPSSEGMGDIPGDDDMPF